MQALARATKQAVQAGARGYAAAAAANPERKVAVLGAAGGIMGMCHVEHFGRV